MKVDAVVFDYGNTLVLDPFDEILRLKVKDFQRILAEAGYTLEAEQIIQSWTEATNTVNYPHITYFQQELPILEQALKMLNITKDRKQLAESLLKIYRDGYRALLKASDRKDEILATLKALKNKGKILAVLSNGRKWDADNAMKALGLTDYFEHIIASEEIGVEKPNPKAFLYVLEKLGKKAENVAYVGDDPLRDIQAAKDLGLKAILFIPPKKYRKSKSWRDYDIETGTRPDAEIKSLKELTEIIV